MSRIAVTLAFLAAAGCGAGQSVIEVAVGNLPQGTASLAITVEGPGGKKWSAPDLAVAPGVTRVDFSLVFDRAQSGTMTVTVAARDLAKREVASVGDRKAISPSKSVRLVLDFGGQGTVFYDLAAGSTDGGTGGDGGVADAAVTLDGAPLDGRPASDLVMADLVKLDLAMPDLWTWDLVPSCLDKVKNQTETDIDCGGSCGPCADGKACVEAKDCKGGVCRKGACVTKSCPDGKKNDLETDVDCGGPDCPVCEEGKSCKTSSDCRPESLCGASGCTAPVIPGGLRIWLRHDKVGVDKAKNVTRWDDASNNAFHLDAASVPPPTLTAETLGGRPAVHFTHTLVTHLSPGKAFDLLPVNGKGEAEYTALIVVRPGASQPTFAPILDYWHADCENFTIEGDTGNSYAYPRQDLNPTKFQVLMASRSIDLFYRSSVNGVGKKGGLYDLEIDTCPSYRWTGSQKLVVGGNFREQNRYFSGDIAEIMIFNRWIEDSGVTDLVTYLKAKHGIQ